MTVELGVLGVALWCFGWGWVAGRMSVAGAAYLAGIETGTAETGTDSVPKG